MREIKFRAWSFGLKKMFSAEEMASDQMALLPDGYFANIHSKSTKLSRIFTHEEMLPLQFTGLKDKNGKEIYEGDILGFHVGEDNEIQWTVKWSTTPYTAHYDFGIMPRADFCTVIGNIYENPEL